MAVNKVVNRQTSSHGAMRNVLEYILRDQKIQDGYVEISGPYDGETVNYDDVYRSWLTEKKLWDKDSGRMYAHNIISFHRDEQVTPEQVLNIGKEFAERFFSGYQYVVGVHQDKDHLHCHIVTNTVSYINGFKLHQTKHDLEFQKEFTNQLCMDLGLTIAVKGQHFDGSPMKEGHVIAWNKDKYNLLLNDSKQSFVADCAIAIMESAPLSASREEFIACMQDRGWSVQWADNRKHIVFQNDVGQKVRDSKIEKTFNMNVNKEALTHEFERQNELRITESKIERNRTLQLEQYYSELESAISGAGSDSQAIGNLESPDFSTGSITLGRETGGPGDDTASLVRTVQSDINDSRLKSRTIRRAAAESDLAEQQSIANAEQRRLTEQRWDPDFEEGEGISRKVSRSVRWD